MARKGLWPTVRSTDADRGGRGDLIQAVRGNESPSGHFKRWPTPHGMPKEGQARNPGPSGNELGRAVNQSRAADVADAEVLAIGAGLRPSESRGQRGGRPGDGGGPSREGGLGNADSTSAYPHPPAGSPREAVGESGWWELEPDVGRVAHGVPMRVDRLRSLGNALVPQIAEWIGRRIMSSGVGR